MVIKGVSKQTGTNCVLFRVQELTPELEEAVRSQLAAICYGDYQSKMRGATYQKTVVDFVRRYEAIVKNRDSMRVGMLGELLGHVLIRQLHSELRPSSIILNKEEYQIKKGFDANFYKDSEYWFGEVKSGELNGKDINEKNKGLLYDAKADVQDKILDHERAPIWDSAKMDALLTFEPRKHKTILEQIEQNREVAERTSTVKFNNAVLISVPFGDVSAHNVNIGDIEAYAKKQLKNFSKCIVITIQKSTVSKLEEFIRKEALTYVS